MRLRLENLLLRVRHSLNDSGKRLTEMQSLSAHQRAKPETPLLRIISYLIGSDCRDTLDSVVIYRDVKRNSWRTLFKDESFKRENGKIVSREELKKLMFAPGDGVVTNRSLKAETLSAARMILTVKSEVFQCEAHNRLVTNVLIQDKILALLQGVEEG
jgi:hypothetical protein